MLNKLRSPFPAIAWFIIIHCAMLFPFHSNPDKSFELVPHMDKMVHFTMFFLLCLMWTYYISSRENVRGKFLNWIILIPILASLDGLAVEFLQKHPAIHRDFEWFDALADTLGAICGTITARWLYRKFTA